MKSVCVYCGSSAGTLPEYAAGFLRAAHRDMLLVEARPANLLDQFSGYRAPSVTKWRD